MPNWIHLRNLNRNVLKKKPPEKGWRKPELQNYKTCKQMMPIDLDRHGGVWCNLKSVFEIGLCYSLLCNLGPPRDNLMVDWLKCQYDHVFYSIPVLFLSHTGRLLGSISEAKTHHSRNISIAEASVPTIKAFRRFRLSLVIAAVAASLALACKMTLKTSWMMQKTMLHVHVQSLIHGVLENKCSRDIVVTYLVNICPLSCKGADPKL